MIKVISFDLDDTLTDSKFDTLLWDVELPKIYAQEKGISLEESTKFIMEEYDNLMGKIDGDWKDIVFWLKRYNLSTTWEELLELLKHEIKHFPEVKEVLQHFKDKGIKLIIHTSADRKFLDAKLKVEGIENFFDKTYSTPSDFNKENKEKVVFEKILLDFGINASEMLHVGDDKKTDVDIPRSLGIHAVLIDRSKKQQDAIQSLEELKPLIEKINGESK